MTDARHILSAWIRLDPELRALLSATLDERQQQRVQQAVDELQRLSDTDPEVLSLIAALRDRLPQFGGLSALYPATQRDIRDVVFQEAVTPHDVQWVAREVGGSAEAAEHFMTRPRPEFGDLTPQQLVEQGRGREVVYALLNVAGL